MKKFSIPLLPGYHRPVFECYSFTSILDTGAILPVFSVYAIVLEKVLNAELVLKDTTITGFGGEDPGDIYKTRDFKLGNLLFKELEFFVPKTIKLQYPFLFSATMFYGTAYEVDTIHNLLNVTLEDNDNMERDFKIKDLKGKLYPQINGALLQIPDMYFSNVDIISCW